MSPPHGYINIPSSPSSESTAPLVDEKGPSHFAWIYSPSQPIALPLTSAEVEHAQKQQHKACVRRRFLRAFLLVFGVTLLLAAFDGFRFPSCMSSGDFGERLDADSVNKDHFTTSHLTIYRSSGSIKGEYTLKPNLGSSIIIGDNSETELAPGYSTSAHIWTKSGSVDVGIKVVEEDDDDDIMDAEKKRKKQGTLLTVGSESGSVRGRLHSRPASSPVHASFRSTSGSIHVYLPGEFSGPFRAHSRSGSFHVEGSFEDRLVIETEVDGLRQGWIYAEDDFQRISHDESEDHKESLTISAESGSITIGDA